MLFHSISACLLSNRWKISSGASISNLKKDSVLREANGFIRDFTNVNDTWPYSLYLVIFMADMKEGKIVLMSYYFIIFLKLLLK